MNISKSIAAALLAACVGSAFAATPEPINQRDAETAWANEGLQPVEVKGFDVVYVRPGATLGDFRQLQIEPVSVAFRRDWDKRKATGSAFRVRDEDMLRIKEQLAELVLEQVRTEMTEGGYTLVDAPGENVLTVGLSIVNLDITAPDLQTAGRTRSYATSAGEMTLVADLRDSVSGELLVRILDRARARESAFPQVITRVDNVSEARHMAKAWAKSLREGLDGARSSAD